MNDDDGVEVDDLENEEQWICVIKMNLKVFDENNYNIIYHLNIHYLELLSPKFLALISDENDVHCIIDIRNR